jgi:hypothetical protein
LAEISYHHLNCFRAQYCREAELKALPRYVLLGTQVASIYDGAHIVEPQLASWREANHGPVVQRSGVLQEPRDRPLLHLLRVSPTQFSMPEVRRNCVGDPTIVIAGHHCRRLGWQQSQA